MKFQILLLAAFLLFSNIVLAVDFIPQGNISLQNIYTIKNWKISNCTSGAYVKGISVTGAWICDSPSAGSGDITGVNTTGPFLLGGCLSGQCNLTFNDTLMNLTIDARLPSIVTTLPWGNITDRSLNISWTGSLGMGNITDISNCTSAQKVLGKVGSAWVCDTDLFNSSTQMDAAINATANRYFQLKVNESVYLNGKASSFYWNQTGNIPFNNITDISNCSAGNAVMGKVGSAWVCSAFVTANPANVSNSSNYLGGKAEANLNVNNSDYLDGLHAASFQQGTEQVNTTAEMRIAVNNTPGIFNITVNNSNYLGGKAEANLNVNNSDYLDGLHAASFQQGTEQVNTTAEMRIAVNNTPGVFNITVNNSNYLGGYATSFFQNGTEQVNTSAQMDAAINATANRYFQIKSNETMFVSCTAIYGGTDADFCTDATGGGGSGTNYWQVGGIWMWPNTTAGGQNSINVTTLNATTVNQNGNKVLDISGGINIGNITDPTDCTVAQKMTGKTGSSWDCGTDLFNTSSEIWTVIDNNTFHKFSQTITWGNLSSWNLNVAWTGSLGGGNITTGTITTTQIADGTITTADLASSFAINFGNISAGWDLNKAWTNTLGAGNLTAGTLSNASLTSTFKILLGNVTDVANCTSAQKILGKVGSAWVCDTDLFNSSTQMDAAINATANRYFQIKSNESDYLDGQHGAYYLNVGGFNAGNLTSGTISNIAIVSNQWVNTSTGVNASKVYSPLQCFDQPCAHNITWNGSNVIIYG